MARKILLPEIENKFNYDSWCKEIAESSSKEHLIKHFREHVCEHYKRHFSEGELSLEIWMIGALNFLSILEKKFPEIKTEDRLFKLCSFYKNHQKGPEPSFDVNEFIKRYSRDDIKNFPRRVK